jgi:hypothetical protein
MWAKTCGWGPEDSVVNNCLVWKARAWAVAMLADLLSGEYNKGSFYCNVGIWQGVSYVQENIVLVHRIL